MSHTHCFGQKIPWVCSGHVLNFKNTAERAQAQLQRIHRRKQCGEIMLKKQQNVQLSQKLLMLGTSLYFLNAIVSVFVPQPPILYIPCKQVMYFILIYLTEPITPEERSE